MDVDYIYSALVWERSIAISLSVCVFVREHISGTVGQIVTRFCMQIPRGRGSVLLWQRCNKLCKLSLPVLWFFGRLDICTVNHVRPLATLCLDSNEDQMSYTA